MVTRSKMITVISHILNYQWPNSFALNAHKENNTFVKRKIPHYTLKALYIYCNVKYLMRTFAVNNDKMPHAFPIVLILMSVFLLSWKSSDLTSAQISPLKTILILPRLALKMLDTTVKLRMCFLSFFFVHYSVKKPPSVVYIGFDKYYFFRSGKDRRNNAL